MDGYWEGLPGGAQQASVGTSESYIDLSEFVGQVVAIWSDDQDFYFCFTSAASGTLVTSGTQAASSAALVATRVAKGYAVPRVVTKANYYLTVKHVTGSGTIRVKPVKRSAGYGALT